MRISDWSSDVCSSDLLRAENEGPVSLRKTAEQGPHMLGGRDDEQRVRPVKFAKVAGRADRPRKRNARKEKRVGVGVVDRPHHLRLARPEPHLAADRKSTRLNSSH